MNLEVVVIPHVHADRLGADLLGLENVLSFKLAVGMVAAYPDVNFVPADKDDVFHLAAGAVSDELKVLLLSQKQVRALEDRRDFLRRGHAEVPLKLADVLHGFLHVASGIADRKEMLIFHLEGLDAPPLVEAEGNLAHGSGSSLFDFI